MADWAAEFGRFAKSLRVKVSLSRVACAAMVAGSAFAAAAWAANPSTPPPPRAFQAPRDCYQPLDRTDALTLIAGRDDGRLQTIAQACTNAAEQQPQRGLIFAYFYAGWANRVLGAGPLNPPRIEDNLAIDSPETMDEAKLREAARLLDIAARMASVANPDGATLAAQRRARLELVRAHRLIGRLRDQDDLRQAQRELTAFSRDGAGDLQDSLSYERAMLVLESRRADQDDDDAQLLTALQDLSTFTNIDPSPRDQYIVDRGPTQLARLAVYMGNRALNREPQTVENTQLAMRNFRDAVSAYGVLTQLGGRVDHAQAAGIRVRMGLIGLRMASVLGQDHETAYGCAPGSDRYSISEAEANFRAARDLYPQSPDAQWGLGCALMARGNTGAALDAFQQAVANLNAPGERALPRSEYYLGLARALSANGQWDGRDGAIAFLRRAVDSEQDATRQAGIYVEIARIYEDHEHWAEASQSLQRAISAQPSARAYLRLGKILYDHPQLENGDSTARSTLRAAAGIDGPHQAEANYFLSKVEERARHGFEAVNYATVAARLDSSNPQYRQQACLTRIVFKRTHDSSGQAYCTANASDTDAYPTALFYEGMFWLREAYVSSGGNQRNNWAQAILSFEHGATVLGDRQVFIDDNIALSRLLVYGRRFALYCAGLGAAVQAQPGDVESDDLRTDFRERYDLGRCWGR
jgi:tetratricopeptide (TPR) repeat protein